MKDEEDLRMDLSATFLLGKKNNSSGGKVPQRGSTQVSIPADPPRLGVSVEAAQKAASSSGAGRSPRCESGRCGPFEDRKSPTCPT